MPASADAAAARAFEAERLGDDADGQDALVARRLGDDRRGAGAGAAAHAGGDEAHMRAFERLLDLVERLFGGGLPISGREPAPRPWVILRPSWMRCVGEASALSACASVLATMKSTPWTSDCDHVGDGVAAGAADADHADPRA